MLPVWFIAVSLVPRIVPGLLEVLLRIYQLDYVFIFTITLWFMTGVTVFSIFDSDIKFPFKNKAKKKKSDNGLVSRIYKELITQQ